MNKNIQILNSETTKNVKQETVSSLLQEAYNLRKQNLFKESLVIYNKAVQMQPENYKIYFNRAYT